VFGEFVLLYAHNSLLILTFPLPLCAHKPPLQILLEVMKLAVVTDNIQEIFHIEGVFGFPS
jgi:hypothetical protein